MDSLASSGWRGIESTINMFGGFAVTQRMLAMAPESKQGDPNERRIGNRLYIGADSGAGAWVDSPAWRQHARQSIQHDYGTAVLATVHGAKVTTIPCIVERNGCRRNVGVYAAHPCR